MEHIKINDGIGCINEVDRPSIVRENGETEKMTNTEWAVWSIKQSYSPPLP